MKVKKEPIILAVIIIALILYLVMRNNDRTNYELPDIAKIPASEISGIGISGPSGNLSLKKTDDKWHIDPQGYPADTGKVQAMLEIIERPDVITMVSESKNYARYGLEKDKKIIVKAFSKGRSVREFEIGDTTVDKRQTFIKLSDDYRIYHSPKNIRAAFEKKADDLRDKGVLSFDVKDITDIRITKSAQDVHLKLKQTTAEKNKDKSAAVAEKSESMWQDAEGRDLNKSAVDGLLSMLSRLSCKEYLNDTAKEALADPVCTVLLTGKKKYSLSIFPKKDNDTELYPVTSSDNDYPFRLTNIDAGEILDAPDKIFKKNEGQ